jgi:hypothetical protein
VQQLGQALQSGDLAGAQSAFNAIQTLGQSGPFANSEPFRNTQREQDFAAIGQALQSGDLAGAQQAFAALQSSFHSQGQPANAPTSSGPAVVVNLGETNINPAASAAPSSPASNAVSEIVINLGETNINPTASAAPSSPSSNAGSEIVINLGANNGAPQQVTIDVNNSGNSGAEQLSISLGTQQNPTSEGQINLNINANSNEQIILNLLNGPASSSSPSSGGLSVVA